MNRVWRQGRETIDLLLEKQDLQRVPANRELAEAYLAQAEAHLDTSRECAQRDPIGAFQLAYDAARKSLASLLVVQGLRPTSRGGHIAVYEAVMAQFGNGLGPILRPFASMRRLRNSSEYPSLDRPTANLDDALRAHEQAGKMLSAATKLIDQLPVY